MNIYVIPKLTHCSNTISSKSEEVFFLKEIQQAYSKIYLIDQIQDKSILVRKGGLTQQEKKFIINLQLYNKNGLSDRQIQ